MQAGMGETVFTPIYKVLKSRGVAFKFFHKVERLVLSPDRSRISAVQISVQALLKSGEYDPFCRVKQWDCWAHEPKYEELVEGDRLKEAGVNLESSWSDWPPVETITLRAGEDFDTVVLGIPIAALKHICAELAEARSDWKQMFENVKTIQTQGFQFWLDKDLSGCGWELGSPILGSYMEPINTWADMSHLIQAEEWVGNQAPKQLAYFVGVMKDPTGSPDTRASGFPAIENECARREAILYVNQYLSYLWPKACHGNTGTFDWNLLVCGDAQGGEMRFQSQYWRANFDPSELYTLAVAGSTKYRLPADHSGFANLVLAGDWLRNGLNTPGCIESAVISGRQAARAISRDHFVIIGESDLTAEAWLKRILPQRTAVGFSRRASRRPGPESRNSAGRHFLKVADTAISPPQLPIFPLGTTTVLVIERRDGSLSRVPIEVPRSKTKKRPLIELQPVTSLNLHNGVGWLRLSMFPGAIGIDVARDIDTAIRSLESERLIIDLRGNTGGGIGCLRLMSLLTPNKIPAGYSVTRRRAEQGFRKEDLAVFDRIPSRKIGLFKVLFQFAFRDQSIAVVTEGLGAQKFHGKVVLLVNEHSASSSEMVAAFATENGLATIVGTHTAGRLLAGHSFRVAGGYRIAIPVAAYYTWQGTLLEGKGVTPHIQETFSPEAIRRGEDNQLQAAIRAAKEL